MSSSDVLRGALHSAARTLVLLVRHRLHLRQDRNGRVVETDRGKLVVFRESTCDGVRPGTVTLFVWFHLRGVPKASFVRARVFERLCILNTPLFAGWEGYRVKLWMVEPLDLGYAGLYSWTTRAEAERYGEYITAVLRPLSVSGTVGFEVYDETLEAHLAARWACVPEAVP
jgi:hypothetical protein